MDSEEKQRNKKTTDRQKDRNRWPDSQPDRQTFRQTNGNSRRPFRAETETEIMKILNEIRNCKMRWLTIIGKITRQPKMNFDRVKRRRNGGSGRWRKGVGAWECGSTGSWKRTAWRVRASGQTWKLEGIGVWGCEG